MSTVNPPVLDPHTPVVYRRNSTIIWAAIMAVFFGGLAVFLGMAYVHHGFFSIIAPLAAVTPFLTFAILGLAWPHVIVNDDVVTVRNVYATHVIPYGLIREVAVIRIGMFIRVHNGPKIPVTAYASGGNSARVFGHKKSNARLQDAIEDKISWTSADVGDAAVTRTVDVRNILITVAAFVIPAIVILLAVVTYH
jgi:hypothetical protein